MDWSRKYHSFMMFKTAFLLHVAVNVISDGNKMNPVLTEHHLCVEAGLQVISADSTQLAQQVGNPRLDIRHKAFPSRAFKITARPSIVRIVDDVFIASLLCVSFKVTFLIQNGFESPAASSSWDRRS